MAPVIWLSVTVASVVATWVIRFGNARLRAALVMLLACAAGRCTAAARAGPGRQLQGGASSQVSVTCSLYPSQNSSRLTPHRASMSYGEAIRDMAGRETVALRLLLPPLDHLPPVCR